MRSFWLCKKANRRRALKLVHERDPKHLEDPLNTLVSEKGGWRFEIFDPKSESEVRGGTVNRGNATCPCCKTVLSVARVRAQLVSELGGADVRLDSNGDRIGGARVLAVVTLDDNKSGRQYRLPTRKNYEIMWRALGGKDKSAETRPTGQLSPITDELVHSADTRNFWVAQYGPATFGDLFTAREARSLVELAAIIKETPGSAVQNVLGLLMGRVADFCVSLARWKGGAECPVQALARQALPFVWDFAEVNPWSDSTGSLVSQCDRLADGVVSSYVPVGEDTPGQVQQADACSSPLVAESASCWFTDPPYYDAIPYADLSDFFFVWLKRALPTHPLLRDPFKPTNPLTPKDLEIVQNLASRVDGRTKDGQFFEERMAGPSPKGGASCITTASEL